MSAKMRKLSEFCYLPLQVIIVPIYLLRPIDVSILFFRKIWSHAATTGSAYEIRVERADNGLMNLKRVTERAPRSS